MNHIMDRSGIMLDAIMKSNDIYRLAFDISKTALAVVDTGRKFMRANQEFCRLTGYAETDLVGMPLDEIITSARTGETGDRFVDADYERKDGASRRGRFNFHALGGTGSETGWLVTLEDMPGTDRSRNPETRHEEFLHCLIENNADGILFLDGSGRILHMNEAARKQMGSADFNDALDMDYANFWKGAELSAALTAIESAANGSTGRFQACVQTSPPRWWDVTITPITVDGGGIHRLMAVSRDITSSVRAEQMLGFAKKQLDKTVRECGMLSFRSERLGAELRKAREEHELLSAAVREKETRAREIHHRAKNNMQILASMVHLQSMRTDDKRVSGVLNNVTGRISAMAKVHDMFCQSGKSSHINFREYITELVSEITASHGNAEHIMITADIEEIHLGIVEAVPCGLLVNEIATNAVKHAFPEDRRGEITVQFREDESGYTLAIRDNGIGLPAEIDINRPGTLGIDLIRELVLQLKGTVTIERSGGTAYTVQFPKSACHMPR